MKTFLAIIGTIVLMFLSATWYGYVLSIVWGWFVAPTFGIARLSVPVAIGISTTIRFITNQDTPSNDEEKSTSKLITKGVIKAAIVPTGVLFFCWIVKHWV